MIIAFVVLTVAVVALDLITKLTIPGILNPGISWGLGASVPWLWLVIVVFSFVIAAGLIGYMVWYLRRISNRPELKKRQWLNVVGVALFAGGVLGNAIDRLITGGAVHDFINFVIFKNNLADIAICVGAMLVFISIIIQGSRGE